MRQGMSTLSRAPSTTFHIGYLSSVYFWIITSCSYFIIWEVLLAITRWFLTLGARGTCIFITHTFIHIFHLLIRCPLITAWQSTRTGSAYLSTRPSGYPPYSSINAVCWSTGLTFPGPRGPCASRL